MERIDLETQLREEKGKQLVKQLRKQGFIPAVMYESGKDSLGLKVSEKEFVKVISTKAGTNVIINLKISAKPKTSPAAKGGPASTGKTRKDKTVMIKEIQKEPVHGNILHVDFNEISLTETLKVQVRVEPKGEPLGLKEGGTLERIIHEVDVECLPTEIPEKLEIDVSNLNIGDSVFVKDIIVSPGIKILQNPELIVMSVKPPYVEPSPEAAIGEEAAEEPELIKKERKVEEEEEGTPAKEEGKKPKEEAKKEQSKEEKK